MTETLHLAAFGFKGLLIEILGDQGKQLTAARVNLGQIGSEFRGKLLILLKHLAVAQNVIDGRPQIVPDF